jgi:hypothetical protein
LFIDEFFDKIGGFGVAAVEKRLQGNMRLQEQQEKGESVEKMTPAALQDYD